MKMDAVLLRNIFIGAIVGVIIAAGTCFYFASQFLRATALDTAHAKADADLMSDDLQKLKRLETEMKEKADIVDRAAQIVSDSSSFQHQNQIVQDVSTYAELAGVRVSGFSFAPESGAGSGSPATAAATSIPGVKTLNATVTLETPIQYDHFLTFLKAIEQNLTKMQVTGINMTPSAEDPNQINNPTIGLLIYVKE